MKRKQINRILGWLYDLALWPWVSKSESEIDLFQVWDGQLTWNEKDVIHPFMTMILTNVTMVGWADVPDMIGVTSNVGVPSTYLVMWNSIFQVSKYPAARTNQIPAIHVRMVLIKLCFLLKDGIKFSNTHRLNYIVIFTNVKTHPPPAPNPTWPLLYISSVPIVSAWKSQPVTEMFRF